MIHHSLLFVFLSRAYGVLKAIAREATLPLCHVVSIESPVSELLNLIMLTLALPLCKVAYLLY